MFIPGGKRAGRNIFEMVCRNGTSDASSVRLQAGIRENGGSENLATYEMLIQGGVHDENELDESGQEYDLASLAEQENAVASRAVGRRDRVDGTGTDDPGTEGRSFGIGRTASLSYRNHL